MLPRAISLCPSIFIPPSFSRYISGTIMHQCFFAFNHTRSIMSEQSRPGRQSLYDDSAPTSLKAVKVLTATTIGAGLSLLSGLTLTGTVIGLIAVTPLLVLFSPVLVPAAIASFLAFAGFVFSGGCGAAGIVVLTWIYQYVTGKHPPGADKLDQAKEKFATKAREMKEKAREYGQQVQQKAQVTTQGS